MNGKLSNYDTGTLRRAAAVLCEWIEWAEEEAKENDYEPEEKYEYRMATHAETALLEFVASYEERQDH